MTSKTESQFIAGTPVPLNERLDGRDAVEPAQHSSPTPPDAVPSLDLPPPIEQPVNEAVRLRSRLNFFH